jgi:hypothetical protein
VVRRAAAAAAAAAERKLGSPEAKRERASEEEEEEEEEEEDAEGEELAFLGVDVDDLDASGVCDTPVQPDRGLGLAAAAAAAAAAADSAADDSEGSDTETEHRELHGLAASPSSGAFASGHGAPPSSSSPSARAASARGESKYGAGGDTDDDDGGGDDDHDDGESKKSPGAQPPQDALASIFEFLDDTESHHNHQLETESNTSSSSSSAAAASLLRAPLIVGGGSTAISHHPRAADSVYDWETESQLSAAGGGAPSIAGSVATQMTQMSALTGPIGTVYDGMKARLTGLTMEVEDKSRTLSTLKRLLREARQAHRDAEEEHQTQTNEKVAKVRGEYEATIARHLSFVDRLLADKQSLSDKCDALAEEMKRVERRHGARAQEIQERHVGELRRQKEALAAGERARRERWTEEQRRQIKESTLKGLEPELQVRVSFPFSPSYVVCCCCCCCCLPQKIPSAHQNNRTINPPPPHLTLPRHLTAHPRQT